MDIQEQREIAISILSRANHTFNLYTEYSEKIKDSNDLLDISTFLERYLNKHSVNYFSLNNSTGDFIINNEFLPRLLKKIKTLPPTKFEKLSAILGKCFGFNEYFATKKSHDQGIDVIGVSNNFRELFDISSDYRYYLFGQCKKNRKNIVDTGEITNLTGSVDQFKSRAFAVKNPQEIYSKFKIKLHTPVHTFFISGYFFSNNALTLCANCDIIPIDIIDMAIILLKQLVQGNLDWLTKKNKLSYPKINRDIELVVVES